MLKNSLMENPIPSPNSELQQGFYGFNEAPNGEDGCLCVVENVGGRLYTWYSFVGSLALSGAFSEAVRLVHSTATNPHSSPDRVRDAMQRLRRYYPEGRIITYNQFVPSNVDEQ